MNPPGYKADGLESQPTVTGKTEESSLKSSDERYRFYVKPIAQDEARVTIHNWVEILRREHSQILDLWMIPDLPKFTLTPVEPGSQENATGSTSESLSLESRGRAAPEPDRGIQADEGHPTLLQATEAGSPPPSPNVGLSASGSQKRSASGVHTPSSSNANEPGLPFLAWPLVDDLGETDGRPQGRRVSLLLNSLGRSLRRKYEGFIDERVPEPSHGYLSQRPYKARVRPSTAAEVFDLLQRQDVQSSAYHDCLMDLYSEALALLELFLPPVLIGDNMQTGLQSHGETPRSNVTSLEIETAAHPTVKLYWGVIWMIVSVSIILRSLYNFC